MSKKGPQRKNKAISVPASVNINRKSREWAVKTKAGPHKKSASVPLGILLRDLLKVVKTMKEADKILYANQVKVDGIVRKDNGFSIGIFDIVSLPTAEKSYRILIDKKGRIFAKEMEKDSGEKICRIEKKIAVKKAIQITTHDGKTFKGVEANVLDSIKIKVPENKILSVLPLQANAKVYITSGSHSGETAEIVEIIPGTARREKIVKLKSGDKEFETTAANICVVGDKKEEIEELK
jgi:small subunit ribosomal protein S4e